MSEEVETTPAAPAEILPAKSEDKLIIEKEEQEGRWLMHSFLHMS